MKRKSLNLAIPGVIIVLVAAVLGLMPIQRSQAGLLPETFADIAQKD
jgi:hypothetical protein